ncbi:M20 aminoacylase family protein [Pararhodobacter sp.]|uniref:M20 aminoacylase family protein n=1 Tax=Pararhodobacter sp. TaxID=2127056 RepID=UPI002AFEDB17|nr:M20 aminoacylase family protein [Pararhodobacter sp.]
MPLSPDELSRLVALRHDLHAHPELGFEETRTADLVAGVLEEAGITLHRGLGVTGVVGTLTRGNGPGRIALRADMDALAMPELTGLPHASRNPGRMHACGHDGHTVMLLGAALELARDGGFDGTVHFIFQPAEEGRGGAARMVADGFFQRFPVDRVYGLHNMPGLDPDEIAVVEGPQLASSDRWEVVFTGEGTHGAKPHLGRDPITAAGAFLSAIHTIVARVVDPLAPAVVSACALEAGDFAALNVIPDTARVGGTARAYAPGVRDQLEAELDRIARGIAATYGLSAAFTYRRGVPPVVNDPGATAIALGAARAALPKVRTAFPPSTAGDDFAVFSQEVPGCYAWLGNGPAVEGALHHNTRYDFNDAAIAPGVAYWCALVRADLRA